MAIPATVKTDSFYERYYCHYYHWLLLLCACAIAGATCCAAGPRAEDGTGRTFHIAERADRLLP